MKELAKQYSPAQVEDSTYEFWLKGGWFNTKIDKNKTPYTIVMPPPNITGQLHMGHAMDSTWQDITIRFERMRGKAALWIPGTDHAAIATEARIVAAMRAEGITKEDIGRDGFLKRAWQWKEEYGGRIVNQLKKLGNSCDWQRERFTMDEGCSKAVVHVFKKLYDEGLIYRGERIINWCPTCLTSISDAEVDHDEREGNLWHVRYAVVGSGGEYITVATTRPETMLGDTAVAVHPDDERYKHLVGKMVVLPLMNKEIPVVADTYVDMEFGTGVVKITPAHDPNDFEVGRRHNLPVINVMTEDAHINENGGKYAGLTAAEARKAVVADLETAGDLVKIEPHTHNVGTCYRCKTTIEPRVSMQWFVKMEPLAKPAIEAVKDGTIKYVPERFTKSYLHWMENTRDWTISRQLWWGHSIPAWYCDDCGHITVSETTPTKCEKCGSTNIRQDEDTLDTWFSSALWPFSTLGWPEKTPDFEYFYPTNTLVTAYDIIGFWVSRMIFSGLHHTGKAPFTTVLIHGLVRDSEGRKMSKSLDNGVDPLQVISEYGADALRFYLVLGSAPGNDMRFSDEKVRSSRNFANKLWNAARFVLMNLPEDFTANFTAGLPNEADLELNVNSGLHSTAEGGGMPLNSASMGICLPNEADLELSDKWAISVFNSLVEDVTDNLENFEFGLASQKIYDFIWDVYCDWVIEIAKARTTGSDAKAADTARKVLVWLLDGALKLLHPFMPFITEEIYRALPGSGETIMTQPWPLAENEYSALFTPDEDKPRKVSLKDAHCACALFAEEKKNFGEVVALIRAVRAVRADMNVHPAKRVSVIIETKTPEVFNAGTAVIKRLAGIEEVECVAAYAGTTEGMVQLATPVARVFIPMAQLIDIEKEKERLQREIKSAATEIASLSARLNNQGFVQKAPANVVNDIREKLARAEEKHAKLCESLKGL